MCGNSKISIYHSFIVGLCVSLSGGGDADASTDSDVSDPTQETKGHPSHNHNTIIATNLTVMTINSFKLNIIYVRGCLTHLSLLYLFRFICVLHVSLHTIQPSPLFKVRIIQIIMHADPLGQTLCGTSSAGFMIMNQQKKNHWWCLRDQISSVVKTETVYTVTGNKTSYSSWLIVFLLIKCYNKKKIKTVSLLSWLFSWRFYTGMYFNIMYVDSNIFCSHR